MTTSKIVPVYEMQHYITFPGENESPIRVTEDLTFDADRDSHEYNTQYLDRKKQTTYAMSSTDKIDFEVDLLTPSDFQAKLLEYEDVENVDVVYTRTLAYDGSSGTEAPATARIAKQAPAVLNMKPLKGAANEPIRISGSIVIADDYTKGTFNESTNTFTAAS